MDKTLKKIALIGQPNVGKSSLINMIANNNKLAKISSTPGKTQTINHFLVNKEWYLVDLPGFGYAKISKKIREKWIKMISDYITLRENLQLLFILIDVRLEPQKNDLEFINNMGNLCIPFALIFTKTDKLSATQVARNVEHYKNTLTETWDEIPPFFISSAETGVGKENILSYIETINKQYFENKTL